MEFKIGDRVVCVNPKTSHDGHSQEWRGIKGSVTNILRDATICVRFDTIPAYYSVRPVDIWYCDADELALDEDHEPLYFDQDELEQAFNGDSIREMVCVDDLL